MALLTVSWGLVEGVAITYARDLGILAGDLAVATQFADSSLRRSGWNTFEVYIANLGRDTNVFETILLNDVTLLPLHQRRTPEHFPPLTFDGLEAALPDTPAAPDGVVWYQFYPDGVLRPGSTIVFQIHLQNTNFQRDLVLGARDGTTITVKIPRFKHPSHKLVAITYSCDYRRIFIHCRSQALAQSIRVNGQPVPDFGLLPLPGTETGDMLLALEAPIALRTGSFLHVAIGFDDDVSRHAVVRALSGVLLDAHAVLSPRTRMAAGLDPQSVALCMAPDFACDDVSARRSGAGAPALVQARHAMFSKQPELLCGVGYCVAARDSTWNIYGLLADVVFAKPCSLGWGDRPSRFLEEEETGIELAQCSAQPRPFLYIPERHAHRGRHLEPAELSILTWVALVHGAKGIRYHFWHETVPDGFADCPKLKPHIRDLNRSIRAHQAILAPLIGNAERILDERHTGSEPAGWVKVDSAWSGDRGMVVLIRNLDYRTDALPNDRGNAPRFRVQPKTGLDITIDVPEWFEPAEVSDLLSGDAIAYSTTNASLVVRLERLEEFRVLWIPRLLDPAPPASPDASGSARVPQALELTLHLGAEVRH